MAGAKLATAYYELIASTPGAQNQIARGLIPAAQKAGDKAGKSISDALGKGAEGGGSRAGSQAGAGFAKAVESSSSRVSSIGSGLGKALGTGLSAAATAAVSGGAAVLGTALTAGFNRLTSIDTAKAKLRGLGNDAEAVAAIMKNATSAVKGTAFGLDAAATVAASAVASGIKPGEQLQGVLTTIANVAAAAGTSMDEMGAIFNKAAGAGRADTEVSPSGRSLLRCTTQTPSVSAKWLPTGRSHSRTSPPRRLLPQAPSPARWVTPSRVRWRT